MEALHAIHRGASQQIRNQGMHLSNIETIPGKTTRHVDLVQGSAVRSKNILSTILGGLKGVVGGRLNTFTTLLQETRNDAIERMIENAKKLGANGILNIRFATSDVFDGAAEVLVYGTAVIVD